MAKSIPISHLTGHWRIVSMSAWEDEYLDEEVVAKRVTAKKATKRNDGRDLPVAQETEILIDDKKGRLIDLKLGMQISLQIDKERGKIARITAKSKNAYFFLKAVDQMRRTISVAIGSADLLTVADLSLAKDANILIGTKERRLSDLLASPSGTRRWVPVNTKVSGPAAIVSEDEQKRINTGGLEMGCEPPPLDTGVDRVRDAEGGPDQRTGRVL
jgi:hypothetical protein